MIKPSLKLKVEVPYWKNIVAVLFLIVVLNVNSPKMELGNIFGISTITAVQ